MKKAFKYLCLLAFLLLSYNRKLTAQTAVRPMIWVKPADRQAILQEIEQFKWKKDYYKAFTNRVQADLIAYSQNPKAYLSALPFDFILKKEGQFPPFKIVLDNDKDADEKRNKLQHYLKTGIDCGVLYYLTNEEKYAEYGASVFYTFTKALLQMQVVEGYYNAGWIYQDNHLREAREIGAQLPVLYDFIYPYLINGGKAFDFVNNTKQIVSFTDAEKVFKTYISLALNRGIIDCNWPVLEAASLVGNSLAIDNELDRNNYLQYYLEKNTPHQDALPKVAKVFKDSGNWPESLNYSNGVTSLTTYLMTLLTKLNHGLNLGIQYPEVPLALKVPYNLTYPNNNETILFGDGHRHYEKDFDSYEIAYVLAKMSNSQSMIAEFGSLINSGIGNSEYQRSNLNARSYGAHPYFDEPLKLLWFSPTVNGETKDYPKPTTNILPFAGIVVQRNLSQTNRPEDALMSFVGGGAYVHGHATGMNMELYGKGYVLGSKSGRSAYTTEIHENYYRLFASNNTVIVNGASRGEGEWSNNAINTVKKEALEPEAGQKPVSINNSFSMTSFIDDKGEKAEAKQLRTMAIVRTSPTTGYYVDVFKSKSTLPHQYHDYIYHNIGDNLQFVSKSKDIKLMQEPNRYMANAADKWVRNKNYKHPGWHYFKDVQTSGEYKGDADVLFKAKNLADSSVNMRLFIPGTNGRAYTKVMAPPTTEGPKAYQKKLTPTLLIRKNGEAWDNPFAVVYEPFIGNKEEGSVKSVKQIISNNVFKGFIVESKVDRSDIKQFIITQDADDLIFNDKSLGIKFIGRYAVITLNDKGEVLAIYVGSGSSLTYQKWDIKFNDGKANALNITIKNNEIILKSNKEVSITNPKNYKVLIAK